MNYEKKYKEALEKAKNCLKDGTITNTAISYIGTIFPELIESEDERVRKELLSFFIERAKYTEDSTFNGLSSKEIISWLEKQGEQKPQGKSALEAINEEKVDNANKVEPKQEKLTEFEKAVKQVMEEAIECGDTRNLKADAEMLLSLVHNSSWSEKDKAVLDALIRRLEGDNIYVSPHLAAECLKSLRDRVQSQNTWKPSDEQIEALKDAVSDDLGEFINELSKQFPEVSFAKVCKIATRTAKWLMLNSKLEENV